jgi:hypothetical protein
MHRVRCVLSASRDVKGCLALWRPALSVCQRVYAGCPDSTEIVHIFVTRLCVVMRQLLTSWCFAVPKMYGDTTLTAPYGTLPLEP